MAMTCIKRLARKTICFSRSEELHDKVIGEFIERAFSTVLRRHRKNKWQVLV